MLLGIEFLSNLAISVLLQLQPQPVVIHCIAIPPTNGGVLSRPADNFSELPGIVLEEEAICKGKRRSAV
jgi:hypothetical protein